LCIYLLLLCFQQYVLNGTVACIIHQLLLHQMVKRRDQPPPVILTSVDKLGILVLWVPRYHPKVSEPKQNTAALALDQHSGPEAATSGVDINGLSAAVAQ
jgi:hypothetical protein